MAAATMVEGAPAAHPAPSPPPGAAARQEKVKELVVPLFGADRRLGSFPTRLHSDLRHLVEMLRRGKQPRLDNARLVALEDAFAAGGATDMKSVPALRAQVEAWRAENRQAFDADRYYDGWRAAGYTEHNRGPQERLTRRALELSSIRTEAGGGGEAEGGRREALLALDLGCGTGLSTAAVAQARGCSVGAIGVDLSSEMLKAEFWTEAEAAAAPLAGERLRCDLAQPLPFRRAVFDLAYSVATVHYLVQNTLQRTAEQRLGVFLSSLRGCLAPGARPCTLQAFFTQEPRAVPMFSEACARTGWAACELVVDRPHGGSGSDRDFLYLLAEQPRVPGPDRPPRCPLHAASGATCTAAVESWAEARGVPPPRVGAAHRDWLSREHFRFAKRLVRLQARCSVEAQLDHGQPPSEAEAALALRLAPLVRAGGGGAGVGEDDADASAAVEAQVVAALHGADPPPGAAGG